MAESPLHDMAGRIGQLEGTVRTFMAQWSSQDTNATAGRRVMHDRLDIMSTQITRVATDVQNIQQDVAEMRNDIDDKVMPHVDAIKRDKERKIGAKGVWALVGTAAVGVISALAYIANAAVSHFFPRP